MSDNNQISEDIVPPQNFTLDYRPTWRKWLGFKLFPPKHVNLPEVTWKASIGDCLVMGAVTRFSFVDRLRVLFGGVVRTESKTVTEHSIGQNVTACESYVEPPKWLVGLPKEIKADFKE